MGLEWRCWVKRLVGRANWDKYSGQLEATIELRRDGAVVPSENVILTREKYGKQSFKLTRKQLLHDGYVTNKEGWIPPEYAVVKIESIGEVERHTVVRRTKWIRLDTLPPSKWQETGSHRLERIVPVEVTPVKGCKGKEKFAIAGALYEEAVIDYRRGLQVLNKVWKRRVHGGKRVSLSGTLLATAPGLRVVLSPLTERKIGRTHRVVSYEDFHALKTVIPQESDISASSVTEFSTASPEELARNSGLGGMVGVHGAEWEPIGMRERPTESWNRLFPADLRVDGIELKGSRSEVEAALRAFLGKRGQAFRLG